MRKCIDVQMVVLFPILYFLWTMLVIFQTSCALIKFDKIHTQKQNKNTAHSIACCITLKLYDFWYNISQVSDVFHTLFCINSFPECTYMYTISQLLLYSWLDHSLMYSFSLCHKFSMAFRSGGSGGVFHMLTWFSFIQLPAYFDECLESLSIMKRWPPTGREQR